MAKQEHAAGADLGKLPKSPVNEAVAELIKTLRSRAKQDAQALAKAFGLSGSYVRAIEAGQRSLPAYAVVGLVEQLGMTWWAASALVAIAGFMDRARTENDYSCNDLLRLSQRLRESWPQCRDFLDGLEELVTSVRPTPKGQAAAATADARPGQWSDRILRLSQLLERCVNQEGRAPNPGVRSPANLNPVFEDLTELLIEQLAMFPPHVNAAAIQRWERKNNDRILSLLVYVSDSETLKASSSEDWRFIRNGLSPTVRVLVPETASDKVSEVERKFRISLAKSGRASFKHLELDLSHRVSVRLAGTLQPDCSRALVFDFTTRARAAVGSPTTDAQRHFPNAWLYELQRESQDSHTPRWIGFLMDKDPVRGYAVSMNGEHVREWREIFQQAWPDDPAKRSASRPDRSPKRSRRQARI